MPYPLNPPPVTDSGALTYPRTLQRWLDNNPVSPLTRTGTTITLPVFNINSVWNGYSDIVGTYNFEAPNNFSIKGGIGIIGNVNYTLCISYILNGQIYRYALWIAYGSNLNQTIPLYDGQMIKKNFRFEIWSTSQGNVSQTTPITFNTSVLGKNDYRWDTDHALAIADTLTTQFSAFTKTITPVLPTGDLVYQFDASKGIQIDVDSGFNLWWTDQINGVVLGSFGGNVYTQVDEFSGKQAISLSQGVKLTGPGLGLNPGSIAIAFVPAQSNFTSSIVDNGGGIRLGYLYPPGKFTAFDNGVGNQILPFNAPYYALLHPDNGFTEIYNSQSGILYDSFQGSSNTGPDGTISIGGMNMLVLEVLFYQSDLYDNGQYQAIKDYFFLKYGISFGLPLTFPSNATSQPN